MAESHIKDFKRLSRKVMAKALAGRSSDPRFYAALNTLPNPDPILRSMGNAEYAYDAIMSDAHVLGELRSIRAAVLGFKRQVNLPAGDFSDNSPEAKARYLCREWMQSKPNSLMTWDDLIWSKTLAIFYGFRAHELVWTNKGAVLPQAIYDVPNRRFKFSTDSLPRLLTREQQIDGVEIDPYKFIFTRHMPSTDNPYGRAVLSSCFWPYTFKHGGFKFFYEFCERYGLPFAIGKYPQGSTPEKQDELADALVNMIESGVAAIPDDGSVDLLEAGKGGDLPQEALIKLCNKEMSKALTSQTLATDIDGAGSRAASETHKDKADDVSEADRNIICASMNEIFSWITRFNFGDNVAPPVLSFNKDKKPTPERAQIYQTAKDIGANPSKKAFLDEMNIPEAEDANDTMLPAASTSTNDFSSNDAIGAMNFTGDSAQSVESVAIQAADTAIEDDLINPVFQMLSEYENQGKTLAEFMDALPNMFGQLDDKQLQDINSQVLQYALAEGTTKAGDSSDV